MNATEITPPLEFCWKLIKGVALTRLLATKAGCAVGSLIHRHQFSDYWCRVMPSHRRIMPDQHRSSQETRQINPVEYCRFTLFTRSASRGSTLALLLGFNSRLAALLFLSIGMLPAAQETRCWVL